MRSENRIDHVTEFQESFDQAISRIGQGYVMAMMTDAFEIQRVELETLDRTKLYEKGIEIRMFNDTEEVKWFRCSIEKPFMMRMIHDTKELDPFSYWDERQYLDIDETRSELDKGLAHSTGGGIYPLPLPDYKGAQLLIRNYLEYEEDTMQLRIADWRIVAFIREGEGSVGKINL